MTCPRCLEPLSPAHLMDSSYFSKKDFAEGASLLKAKKVGQVLFSEGTYQIEVVDPKTKKHLWPFLQLDDVGSIIDCFCTCSEEEKKKSCAHLAAAYLKIFNDQSSPLHVRFRRSLWNRLCQIASRRHGYDKADLQKKAGGFETFSITGKRLFAIKGLTAQGKKKVETIIMHREVETEETSIKFSNLAPEELLLWRQGRPSHHLQYELSFWSDLAKWWMLLQEEEERYTLTFEEETENLPHWIEMRFPAVSALFYIAGVNWPQIIETLSMVQSSLPVYEFQQHQIEAIRYDAVKAALFIQSKPLQEQMDFHLSEKLSQQAISVGDWVYIPKKGFFPSKIDPIFNHSEIPKEKIGSVLQKHVHLIEKYLVGTPIHPISVKANYTIFFDEMHHLHIRCFVFSLEDLIQEHSAYFGPWVYVHPKGFYRLENLLFEGIEKIIEKGRMNDFINRHRAWLNGFEGFQTHVFAIESQLRYVVKNDGSLSFESILDFADIGGEFIDFGEWIYLKGKGFFAKKIGRVGAFFRSDISIPASNIPPFIRGHKEELEHVKGFFAKRSPLDKAGVEIFLNEQGSIVVRPRFSFYPFYSLSSVQIFGDYTYVPNEGFCEIPLEKRLPGAYTQEKSIASHDEPYFVLYELDMLKPFSLSIQKELIKPNHLSLRISSIKKWGKKKNAAEWILDAHFETDVGAIPLFEIWKAVAENKKYLFSSGGLILLRPPRFNWLKTVHKCRWIKEGKFLKLNTLDWIRLTVLEEILLPDGHSAEAEKTKQYIDSLQTFKTEEPIDLSGFRSELRAYQEVGVRWLHFLHIHGLSGLLCDEMGLGKTHQAMGLLSAAKNQRSSSSDSTKFLVVCPTSVIYHWEDLLKRFLPDLRIIVFYGAGRSLEHFKEKSDLLLTSYGTLRSEKQTLSQFSFDVAIFDEIQIAKNVHSQTHKALKKIDASTRIGLTGTPIENRLLELKALFDIILPGFMPQEAQFKEYFVNPIERNQDPERKFLLSRLTKPFILRRKKAEVLLELPEKIEEIAYCDLSDEQKELYKKAYLQHRQAALKDIESSDAPLPFTHIFSLFSTLKQICDHPCLITKQFDEFQKHRSGKWDLFIELFHETRDSGQKLVIFSQYLAMLDMFAAYLTEKGIGFAGIRGSTRDRKEQLDTFRSDPQCEVFLASLQAAGVGIDLVSASVVIHYDRWWNPARENQATDRVHRIGQNRGVQVFKMVTKDTIEEHIHQMIQKKMTLLEDVISFDEQDQIKGFNREEIVELLRILDRDVEEKL